jgi:hypothetical protein
MPNDTGGHARAMDTATAKLRGPRAAQATRQGAHVAALWGLAARGVLYLMLAFVSIELVVGSSREQADTRGAMHQFAHDSIGSVVLVVVAIGFGFFTLWHAYHAFFDRSGSREFGERAADVGRAVVYGLLCALAVSFVTTSKPAGSTDRTDKTWTAVLMQSSGGRIVVGAVGVLLIGGGLFLLWRAFSGERQDQSAVLEAAPREPGARLLGRIGNVARGVVVGLVGVFVLDAAIEYDPNETVGLDGALKRLLDQPFGGVLVVIVAAGFAAFGVYSIVRAWVNRPSAGR